VDIVRPLVGAAPVLRHKCNCATTGRMLEAPTQSAPAAGGQATPRRVVRVLPTLVAALLVLAAAVLVAVSFASYATVKHRLDQYASDHDAELSRERFRTVIWQLRLLAVVLGVMGASAYRWRRRLSALAETFLWSLSVEASAATRTLRRALAAESRLHLGALGTIVVGAVLVRVEFLFQPMRYDESGTYVHYASQPLYIGLTTYTAPNNHLLNTLLIHVSTAVLGNHPWAIRLPALVAGVALVPATYLAGRLLYDRGSALLAAALVASSSVLIEYSTNARGYTAVALIFILLVALATRLADSHSPAAWAAFAVLAALGFFAIPTFSYAFGALVVWLAWLLAVERRAGLARARLLPMLVAVAVLTFVLYAPVIGASGLHALVSNSFVAPQTWSYFLHHLPSSLGSTFAGWHRDQPLALWATIAFGFSGGLLLHRRLSRIRLSPWVGPLVFIPPLLALQHVVPFERVWLFLLPLYLTTAAAGLLLLVRRLEPMSLYAPATAVVAVALCAALAGKAVASQAVYHSEDTSTFRDAPTIASFLETELRPDDRLLVAPPADLILEYYLDVEGFDAGRLLYTDFQARRLLAVVEEGPRAYTLSEVVEQRLGPDGARGLRPVLLRRYPHAAVYELVEAGA
jgi:hypothetical protein